MTALGTQLVPGLCSVTFRALPAEEVLRLAAENGLGAIEWGGDVHVPAGDIAAADRVARRSAEAGVACASYGSYLQAGDLSPGAIVATLDTAEALGAGNVRVWCRYGPGPGAGEADRAAVADDLRRIADDAAPRRLTVSVEFHPGTLTETADSTRRLLAAVGADNLFTYWQPAPGADPDHLRRELAGVIGDLSHLHVFGWDADSTRRPLAEAESWWPPLLADARAGGRWPDDRVAFLEFVREDDAAQLATDAACVRRWLRT